MPSSDSSFCAELTPLPPAGPVDEAGSAALDRRAQELFLLIQRGKLLLGETFAHIEAEEAWKKTTTPHISEPVLKTFQVTAEDEAEAAKRAALNVPLERQGRRSYKSFKEYCNARLGLMPREARDCVRVANSLHKHSIDAEDAAHFGVSKLAAIIGRMTAENRVQRLRDASVLCLAGVRVRYQPGSTKARARWLPARCQKESDRWYHDYSDMRFNPPQTLEEIVDLPTLILNLGKNSGAAAHVDHLLYNSPVLRQAIAKARLATRLSSQQANLEYIATHFLKTFPAAGYAGLGVTTEECNATRCGIHGLMNPVSVSPVSVSTASVSTVSVSPVAEYARQHGLAVRPDGIVRSPALGMPPIRGEENRCADFVEKERRPP